MDADWDRLRAPEFWRWLFDSDVSFDDEPSFTLELAIGAGDGLHVAIAEGTSVTLLDLRTGTELGWIDDAHFHPSCLRAAEVLHLASRQAAPPTRHLATLLLLPFAVVTNEGDARTLESAAQLAQASRFLTSATSSPSGISTSGAAGVFDR